MTDVILWTIIFSISSATSITLLGQRDLISGNLFEIRKVVSILLDWRFLLSMIFALFSRFSFMMTNNALLKVSRLANASTTITTFVTLISLIFIVITNYIFLKERFNISQVIGGLIVIVGVFILMK